MVYLDEEHDPHVHCEGHLLARRVPASGPEAGTAAASPDAGTAARREEVLLMREQLLRFISSKPIGNEFQAVDFNHWLDQQLHQPDESKVDRRASGGMFIALVRAGVLEHLGYRNNGGDEARNYNGSPRAVYAVASHDFTKLGWLEKQEGVNG